MKKLYTLFFALLVCGGLQAQNVKGTPGKHEQMDASQGLPAMESSGKTTALDTIFDYFDTPASVGTGGGSGSFFNYGSVDGGNILGTAWISLDQSPPDDSVFLFQNGVSVHYSDMGTARVVELLAWTAEGDVIGTADSITAGVYISASDSTPGQLVGFGKTTTANLTVSSSSANLSSIVIDNGTGDVTNSDFCVTMEFADSITSTDIDTIGIVGDSSGDGRGEHRVRLRRPAGWTNAGSWNRIYDDWNGGKSRWDIDAQMFPVIDDAPARRGDMVFKGIKLGGSYPNPANESTTISFELDQPQEVRLHVFDLQGRSYLDTGKELMPAGQHNFNLDVSELAPGTYYYQIRSGGEAFTSRIAVVK